MCLGLKSLAFEEEREVTLPKLEAKGAAEVRAGCSAVLLGPAALLSSPYTDLGHQCCPCDRHKFPSKARNGEAF